MARNALIQVRRDTAANWTSVNPTLAAGEMGVETNTGLMKIGDGSTAWASLTYLADASKITGSTLSVTNVNGSNSVNVTGPSGSMTIGAGALTVYGSTSRVGVNTLSPNYTLEVNGIAKAATFAERWNVPGVGSSGTMNLDALSYTNYLFLGPTGNWTINVRGSSSVTLNSILSTGDSIVITYASSQSSATYYPSTFQIDGSTQTVKWQGGTAPTAGNQNTTDVYVYTILKTSNALYSVFGSQTKFG